MDRDRECAILPPAHDFGVAGVGCGIRKGCSTSRATVALPSEKNTVRRDFDDVVDIDA